MKVVIRRDIITGKVWLAVDDKNRNISGAYKQRAALVKLIVKRFPFAEIEIRD